MLLRFGFLALLLTWSASASAQESAAVRAAKAHFRDAQATQRTAGEAADLSDLHAVDARVDRRAGIEYVYLVQRYDGHEVFGTTSAAAVLPGGRVQATAPRFQAGLDERVQTTTPAVSAEAAAAIAAGSAAEAVRRAEQRLAPTGAPRALTDDPAVDGRPQPDGLAVADGGTPRLGYHTTATGALRLAWETVATADGVNGGHALRRVRVDAVTGAVLADDDLVTHDTWSVAPAAPAPATRLSPVLNAMMPAEAAQSQNGTYRVIPLPYESPTHGGFALVTGPANPVASPRGWHDDGSRTYTTTRGNNVHAYADTDGDNAPDPHLTPDGGSALLFDYAFDPDQAPQQNALAALTNLFYWNNIVHDVAYRYGFDEAAGNFQNTNFIGRGAGSDYVLAEALDGSGANNANFSTPPEGQSPRMQMFLWTGSFEFEVRSPARLAGPYPVQPAAFGLRRSFEGALVPTRGPNGETTGCSPGEIVNDVAGKVALIERGTCTFVEKVTAAQEKGAQAVVIYNHTAGGEELITMSGESALIEIPSAFVQRSTGLAFREAPETVTVSSTVQVDRDSGFDAGVVAHEYAHGISNRLVGGPQEVACLLNGATNSENPSANRPGEQMGEGWSDFYALILTMQPGDLPTQPRGVGTYLRFQNSDGPGIRPAPYSTDFAINDFTYQDVISGAAHEPTGGRWLSIPHGVGFVWATVLWDMTWELVDAFGFSEDIYNADGTAGNQIALNLVTTGLKLTPCTPGFVDGRDAILAADQALYGGAYAPYIWRAFAGRGLGVDASQGLATNSNDGAADFVAPEDLQGAVQLSETDIRTTAGPGGSATATVEVVNNRERAQSFSIDPAALPSWLRVTPTSGTIPAGGRVDLDISMDPSPLATGVLQTTVPIQIGVAARLSLAVRVDTDEAVAGTHQLSPVGPNPSRETVRFTVAVADDQVVEAALYDALGRRVLRTAQALTVGTREAFALDVRGLAAGVYVLRVSGDAFRETRTLTVIR